MLKEETDAFKNDKQRMYKMYAIPTDRFVQFRERCSCGMSSGKLECFSVYYIEQHIDYRDKSDRSSVDRRP